MSLPDESSRENNALPSKIPPWLTRDSRFRALAERLGNEAHAAAQYGVDLFQAGETGHAAESFAAAAALDPAQARYWSNYGVALDALGMQDAAITAFEKSLALDAGQPLIWLNLGNTLVSLGRAVEAEPALRRAAEAPEIASEALAALGAMLADTQRFEEAAAALRGALAAGGSSAILQAQLGAVLFQLGEIGEALAAYEIAAALDPAQNGYRENLRFLAMLNGILAGKIELAVTAYARPLVEDAALIDAFTRAMRFLAAFGHDRAAAGLVNEWLQYYPEDADGLYFQAATRGEALERAPRDWVQRHFDQVAARFNAAAAAQLGYQLPEKLTALLEGRIAPRSAHLLDAGCGIGLLGVAARPLARTLTGIDLSPAMVERARATGAYDALATADVVEFMNRHPGAFDAIAAADTFSYLGALEPALAAAAAALQPGGLLAFSIETTQNDDNRFHLTPTGRFRHARSYVAAAAQGAFRLLETRTVMLRRQGREPVAGTVFLFRRIQMR